MVPAEFVDLTEVFSSNLLRICSQCTDGKLFPQCYSHRGHNYSWATPYFFSSAILLCLTYLSVRAKKRIYVYFGMNFSRASQRLGVQAYGLSDVCKPFLKRSDQNPKCISKCLWSQLSLGCSIGFHIVQMFPLIMVDGKLCEAGLVLLLPGQ